MNPTKKNILLIHAPRPRKGYPLHGDSLSSFPLAKAQMTLAAFNVAPDSPPARLPHGNGKAPMMMSDPISGAGNTHEATAFTGRVIQALEQTGAEALFFQMAFENDEIQLQVLDAVNRKTDIIMGITRTVREKENAFGLPKEFFSLSHLCLIQWQVLHPQDNLDTRPLWQISRQGIWNHFTLDPGEIDSKPGAFLSFILANPNIAHSYQLLPVPMTDGKDIPPEPAILPSTFFPYRNVTPLPGIPLWQVIDNPAHMLLYLTRHTRKELFPMRVNPETGTSFSLGRDISFYFQKPEALPPGYMEEICNMVEAGGSVATQWVRYNSGTGVSHCLCHGKRCDCGQFQPEAAPANPLLNESTKSPAWISPISWSGDTPL